MAKKKEPINVTPPKNQVLVNTDRIKIMVLFNGDSVICDLQEAVNKETGERQAYIMNYPLSLIHI